MNSLRPLLRSLFRPSSALPHSFIAPSSSSPFIPFFSTPNHPLRSFSGLAKPPLIRLNNVQNVPGARKPFKRVGRGPGSGMGKTCGRGHKGKKARNAPNKGPWFEGGQTPLYKKIPKFGFNNVFQRSLLPVNLDRLAEWIKQGRIDPTQTITMKMLKEAGLAKKIEFGVKILAGNPNALFALPALRFEVTDSSDKARAMVEKAGGSVKHVWFNRVTLRAHLKPEKFTVLPRSNGIPPPRLRARFGYDLSGRYVGEAEAEKAFKKARDDRMKIAMDKAKIKVMGGVVPK